MTLLNSDRGRAMSISKRKEADYGKDMLPSAAWLDWKRTRTLDVQDILTAERVRYPIEPELNTSAS